MWRVVTPSRITRLTLVAASAVAGVLLHSGVGPGIQIMGGVASVLHPAGVGPGIQ